MGLAPVFPTIRKAPSVPPQPHSARRDPSDHSATAPAISPAPGLAGRANRGPAGRRGPSRLAIPSSSSCGPSTPGRAHPRSGALHEDARRRGEGTVRPENGMLVASSVGKFPLEVSAVVPGTEPFVDSTSVEYLGVAGPGGPGGGLARQAADDRSRAVAPAECAGLLEGERPDHRLGALALERPQGGDGGQGRGHHRDGRRGSARLTAAEWAAAGVGRGRGPGGARATSQGSRSPRPSRPSARATSCRSPSRQRTRPGRPVADLTPTWSFSPGDGQLGADGRFVAYRPGDYTVTATLGRTRGEHARSPSASATCAASVTVVGRGCPSRRSRRRRCGSTPTARSPTSAPTRAATGCTRSTSAIPAKPGDRGLDPGEHAARQRHADDRRRQLHGVHARGRGRPQERHRDRRHPRSAAPEGDLRVHGRRHGRACTRSTSTRIRSTASTSSSRTTAPAPSTSSNITDPAHPKHARPSGDTDRPDAARYVHDLDIVDGLMYASYWNDGLVILDIGNGK